MMFLRASSSVVRSAAAGALILVCCLLAVACGEPLPRPSDQPLEVAGVALAGLPHPDLESVEGPVRDQINAQRQRLEAMLGEKRPEPFRLAATYGQMGRLYHAYDLLAPASVAYRNAAALQPDGGPWAYLEGLAELERGELPSATRALERAREMDPQGAGPLLQLGESALRQGDAQAALGYFQEAREAAGGTVETAARFGLGRAHLALGDGEAAIRELEAVREAQPQAGAVNYPLATAYRQVGRDEEARRLLDLPSAGEVFHPDPLLDNVQRLAIGSGASMRRGGRALVNGRFEEAAAAFRQAVAADPDYGEAHRNLGLALLNSGDTQAAVEALTQAVGRLPEDPGLRLDLGNALLAEGETERAVVELERAVELQPDLTTARFNLANSLIGLGRWAEADPHLAAVLRADPEDPRARYLQAMSLLNQGRTAEAEQRLRRLVVEAPRETAALQGLVQILTQREDLEGALAAYERYLDADLPPEEIAAAHMQMALLEVQSGDTEGGLRQYEAALAATPDSVDPLISIATLRLSLEDYEGALEGYRDLLAVQPVNPTASHGEAVALSALGRWKEARQGLETALAASPDDAFLQEVLARLLAGSPQAELRQPERALELARQAHGATPSSRNTRTLALALASSGRWQAAIDLLAPIIARARGQNARPEELEADLKSYREGELPTFDRL